MKRILSFILVLLLLSSFTTVLAAEGEARCVIGADLSQEQINAVYETFGLQRGSVTELQLTNSEERALLEGLVDESVIGSNSISCVYIRLLDSGEGYRISASNINWCTEEMYRNALVTAGLENVEVIVTAPFAVSGTAALAGIYKAYEDITGESLDELAKEVGTRELVITGELADEIGSYDAAEIVNELKLILTETRNMSDEELKNQILAIAGEYNVSLNDSQISQLISLCRQLEKLDDNALVEKVKSVQEGVKKLAEAQEKLAEGKEKLNTFKEKVEAVADTVRTYTQPVIDFFKGLFNK